MLLGDVLVRKGVITPEVLERALEIQRTWKSPLGSILISMGAINSLELARGLAARFGLPYRNPHEIPPNPEVVAKAVRVLGEEFLRRNNILPLEITANAVEIVVVDPTDREAVERLREVYGLSAVLFVTSERDMSRAFLDIFKKEYIEEAVLGLFYRNPKESARVTFSGMQRTVLFLLLGLVVAGFWFVPMMTAATLFALVNIFYVISVGFKFAVSLAGARQEILQQVTDEEVAALRDEDLPVYTILLPMYKEPDTVKKLVKGIIDLEYPTSKLDVKILLEEDDTVTFEALRSLKPPAFFQIIRVPYSLPKTKPKACNYGLLFAQGEFLTIYDAEDVPERDQLKKVIVAFRKGSPDLVCVQAALNYFNAEQNFLTRMFTLEYSYWFDYMLPGIEALQMPIPLGGTSNHFRTEVLRELGGWDPFNVTEDADLGVRASAHRYHVATVNSTTFEEANSRVGNWIRQRSWWIKGYMQTYLVHMRHPLRLYHWIGARAFLGFQLLIGGTFATFLCNPLLWMLFLVWIVLRPAWLETLFPPAILSLSLVSLIVGNTLAISLNMLAVFRRHLYGLTILALANPFYWMLHSFAAYKALYQLFTNPFYWEKTVHGLADSAPAQK
jgi:hypothetical protein